METIREPVDPRSPFCSGGRPRMRPTYECSLPVAGDKVLAVIDKRIRKDGGAVTGWVQAGQAELFLPDDLRFFSPALHLNAGERDGRPVLRARFAPLPQVWIVFVGIYFILGMSGLGALMWGLSQMVLGRTPWALLGTPAAAALAAFVYGAAFIGQGLSAPQMYQLRTFVDHAIEDAARQAQGLASSA